MCVNLAIVLALSVPPYDSASSHDREVLFGNFGPNYINKKTE